MIPIQYKVSLQFHLGIILAGLGIPGTILGFVSAYYWITWPKPYGAWFLLGALIGFFCFIFACLGIALVHDINQTDKDGKSHSKVSQ